MRRLLVIAIAIPYALVMWPRWAVRDFMAAYRKARSNRNSR